MVRAAKSFKAIVNDHEEIRFELDESGYTSSGKRYRWTISYLPDGRIHAIIGSRNFIAEVLHADYKKKTFQIFVNNKLHDVRLKNHFDELVERLGMSGRAEVAHAGVAAPMPGMIIEIVVKEGDSVEEGDSLVVLKAMKMENIIKSPTRRSVKRILVNEGESVEKDRLLIEF